jgi:hypothetical protein
MRTDIRAQPRKFIIPCGPRLSPCNGRQEQAGAKLKFRRYPLQLRRTTVGWIVQSTGVCSYSERRANRAISNVRQSSLGDLSGGPHQRLKVVAIRGVDRRVEQTLTCRPDVQKEYQEQHDRDSETRVRRAPSAHQKYATALATNILGPQARGERFLPVRVDRTGHRNRPQHYGRSLLSCPGQRQEHRFRQVPLQRDRQHVGAVAAFEGRNRYACRSIEKVKAIGLRFEKPD